MRAKPFNARENLYIIGQSVSERLFVHKSQHRNISCAIVLHNGRDEPAALFDCDFQEFLR
jgi:hypothetical protein